MLALVTGSTGFIGGVLVEELNTLGFDVRALVRPGTDTTALKDTVYETVEGDLSDLDSLRKAVRGVDYVFHLAGVNASPIRRRYFDVNHKGTKRLAQAVAREVPDLSRFVFVSSLAAGGPARSLKPKTESEKDRPVSSFGESKLEGERSLLRYKKRFPVTVIRPPLVYGPGDRTLYWVLNAVGRNLIPLLRGASGGSQKYYSTVHVKDLVRGVVQAAVSAGDLPSGEMFYIADDRVITYEEFVSAAAERLDRDPLRVPLPEFALRAAASGLRALGRVTGRTLPLSLDRLNELYADYWICSNEKAKKLLGYDNEFTFPDGLSNTIDWYREHGWL